MSIVDQKKGIDWAISRQFLQIELKNDGIFSHRPPTTLPHSSRVGRASSNMQFLSSSGSRCMISWAWFCSERRSQRLVSKRWRAATAWSISASSIAALEQIWQLPFLHFASEFVLKRHRQQVILYSWGCPSHTSRGDFSCHCSTYWITGRVYGLVQIWLWGDFYISGTNVDKSHSEWIQRTPTASPWPCIRVHLERNLPNGKTVRVWFARLHKLIRRGSDSVGV